MKTLYAGPFDGFDYDGPTVEYLDLDAQPLPLPGEGSLRPGVSGPINQVRYWWRADTSRYEWEGLHDGR